MKEKVHIDAGLDLDDDLDMETIWSTKSDVKAQWEHLTRMDSDPEDDLLKPATDPEGTEKLLLTILITFSN